MNHVSNYRVTVDEHGVNTEPILACRCGVTHEGPYATYDYGHHMCFHDSRLVDIGNQYVICPDCGKGWPTEGFHKTAREVPLSRWEQILEYIKALYR